MTGPVSQMSAPEAKAQLDAGRRNGPFLHGHDLSGVHRLPGWRDPMAKEAKLRSSQGAGDAFKVELPWQDRLPGPRRRGPPGRGVCASQSKDYGTKGHSYKALLTFERPVDHPGQLVFGGMEVGPEVDPCEGSRSSSYGGCDLSTAGHRSYGRRLSRCLQRQVHWRVGFVCWISGQRARPGCCQAVAVPRACAEANQEGLRPVPGRWSAPGRRPLPGLGPVPRLCEEASFGARPSSSCVMTETELEKL